MPLLYSEDESVIVVLAGQGDLVITRTEDRHQIIISNSHNPGTVGDVADPVNAISSPEQPSVRLVFTSQAGIDLLIERLRGLKVFPVNGGPLMEDCGGEAVHTWETTDSTSRRCTSCSVVQYYPRAETLYGNMADLLATCRAKCLMGEHQDALALFQEATLLYRLHNVAMAGMPGFAALDHAFTQTLGTLQWAIRQATDPCPSCGADQREHSLLGVPNPRRICTKCGSYSDDNGRRAFLIGLDVTGAEPV